MNSGRVGHWWGACLIARMISIKFAGQVLLSVGGDDKKWDHLGIGIGAIGFDCIAVGVGVAGCHSGVG